MLPSDANELIELMVGLWPEWEPTEEELKHWRGVFLPLTSPSDVREAIRAHMNRTLRKRPIVKGVLDALATLPGPPRDNRPQPILSHWYLLCEDAPAKSHLLGQTRMVWLCCARSREPEEIDEIGKRTADTMRPKLERMYGGQWAVYRAPGDIMGRKLEDWILARGREQAATGPAAPQAAR